MWCMSRCKSLHTPMHSCWRVCVNSNLFITLSHWSLPLRTRMLLWRDGRTSWWSFYSQKSFEACLWATLLNVKSGFSDLQGEVEKFQSGRLFFPPAAGLQASASTSQQCGSVSISPCLSVFIHFCLIDFDIYFTYAATWLSASAACWSSQICSGCGLSGGRRSFFSVPHRFQTDICVLKQQGHPGKEGPAGEKGALVSQNGDLPLMSQLLLLNHAGFSQ